MNASAKVFSMPKYSHDNGSDIISFSFELYSEEAYYTGASDSTGTGGYGLFGGAALPFTLSEPLNGKVGSFNVNNLGNFAAPCKIEVVGSIISPKIDNITAGTFYGVSSTTSDFILDTRSTTAIITDAGVDVSAYRMSGSKYISILPGVNTMLLQGSNYTAESTVAVTITYKDTYISS